MPANPAALFCLTCIIVSKWKLIPFHNVNSPLDDPVSSRLPSGVHSTTLTGCFILFKEECRCFVGIVSAALSNLAAGGNSWELDQKRATFTKMLDVHRLCSLDLAFQHPEAYYPCIVAAGCASIAPSLSHNQ